MDEPGFFSVRRLNPFQGTLQVVQGEQARAFSLDGARWQVQLLTEKPLADPPWGGIGRPLHRQRRYFAYGVWSARDGMKRVPVDPVVGDPSRHPALPAMLERLERLPEPPFPARDRFELWLLAEGDGEPLALIASRTHPPEPAPPPALDWWPVSTEDTAFHSESLAAAGDTPPGTPHWQVLAEQVRRRVGQPVRAQWFRREADGSGKGMEGVHLAAGWVGRRLPATAFPATLLAPGGWPDALQQRLVAEFTDWLAPLLLTLPGLPRGERGRLERCAVRRPLLLFACRRLIPEIVQPDLVEPALVEAQLRFSAQAPAGRIP